MQDLLHIKNRGFEFWNGPIETFQPALNVFTKPRPEGFTAVILTYDRFDYMIKVIQRLVFNFFEIAIIFFQCRKFSKLSKDIDRMARSE